MLKYLSGIILFFINLPIYAEDSLLNSMEIGLQGARVQAERLKIAAENMANENSTGSTSGEDPYRRKVLFVKNQYNKKLKTNLIAVKKYDYDKAEFILKYDPNHPAADQRGYVKYPNIQREIEKADMIEAKNSYEANLSIIEISKAMAQKTLELIK